MKNVEAKVIAATAGGATGGVVGSFILWLLGVFVWHIPGDAGHSIQAVAAVPEPVGGFALFVLAGLTAFAAGYWAPHTPRPDLNPAHSEAPVEAPVPTVVVEAAPPVATPAEPEAPAAGAPPADTATTPAPAAAAAPTP